VSRIRVTIPYFLGLPSLLKGFSGEWVGDPIY